MLESGQNGSFLGVIMILLNSLIILFRISSIETEDLGALHKH